MHDLRSVFDAMPIAVSWAAREDQTILYRNRAFDEMFGYQASDFRTVADWVELTYPYAEDRAVAWERWGAYFASPSGSESAAMPMELRITCRDGSIKTVLHGGMVVPSTGLAIATFVDISDRKARETRLEPERKAQEMEAALRMLAMSSDAGEGGQTGMNPWESLVGERHRQREALRISEELLDRTGRLAEVGGWAVDLRNGTVSWTGETHRIHGVAPGYQPTLAAGIDFYAPEARAMIQEVVETAIETGEGWDVEAPLIRADGQRIWVRTRGSVESADGKAIRLIGAFQDVTARVIERTALKQANERLVLATDSGGIGIWDRDLIHNGMIWDDWMFRLYGLKPGSREPSYAMWISFVIPADRERVAEMVRSALESGTGYESEFRVMWEDGTMHDIRATGKVARDRHGFPVRLVGTNRDVTEQRRLANETARLMKRDMQMKDDFLSHVSHELRSPLASIYSFASILADGLAGEVVPPQDEYLEIILRNSRQLRSMIEDLLQVTQSETGKLSIVLQKTSLEEGIADAVNTLRGGAEAKEITLGANCPNGLPAAFADATRVRQVLIILLDNAIKFTPSEGKVTVRAMISQSDPDSLEVCIADSGPGIEASAEERIFEHLYQVDEPGRAGRKGLGLGLYIARDLVNRQGGKIWVKSRQGCGSEFFFSLPIYREESSEQLNPWGVERRRQFSQAKGSVGALNEKAIGAMESHR